MPLSAEFFCVCCRMPFLNSHPLDERGRCRLCRLGATGFDAAYSFGAYEGTLRKLIQVFKYGRVETLASPLGEMLASALPRDQRFDLIAPMPLHWMRRWTRGFNQADLLARAVGHRFGIPVRSVVRRTRSTAAQAGLTNAKRRANVSGAFAVKSKQQVRGRRILLIDDVLTTGATVSACGLALKKGGAVHVSVLTLARVDRRVMAAESLDAKNLLVTPLLGSLRDVKSGSIA